MDPESQLTPHLPLIERLCVSVCRRNGFPADESEEFASWAKLRLLENDCAIVRKFRGESSISTFLTTVVTNLFRDYRIHLWGKWRPSAEAKRLGPVAIELETLIARDGRTTEEAVAIVAGRGMPGGDGTNRSGGDTNPRDPAALRELAARLPPRTKRRFDGEEALADLAAPGGSDDGVIEAERRLLARKAETDIAQAMAELAAEERLVLKLRFADGMAIVDIAALLRVPAKPLYARIERSLGTLRRELELRGFGGDGAAELMGWAGLDLRLDFGTLPESDAARPSNQKEQRA